MDDSKRVVLVVAITLLILLLWRKQQLLLALRETIPKKSFHRKRKRQDGLDHLARFNDKEVKEQTSLSRTQFNYVLFLIEPELKLSPIQERMARCSSGEPMPVMLKLFMALRVLKGAQLNDLSQFTSAYKQVWGSTFLPVMEAIDKKLDNIHFKCNDPAWREETANQWAWQQQRKYNSCFWWGLLGCGDGLIDQTTDAIAGIISSNGISPLDDMQLAVYLQNLYENNRSVTKRTNYASILQSFGICFETIDAMPI